MAAPQLIGAISEGVGKIFGLGSSFVDKSKEKRKYEGETRLASINLVAMRDAEKEKSKRTMLYVSGAVILIIIAIIGFIVYKKNT
jgi:hypothetical protein